MELVKKYPYEITSIALHSTGLFVALGFSDRLHLMEILLDTLKVYRAFFLHIFSAMTSAVETLNLTFEIIPRRL